MKKIFLSAFFLIFSLCQAQTAEDTIGFFQNKKTPFITKIEVKTPEDLVFHYQFIVENFSSEEIQQIFKIPDSIAAKHPIQVVYLKDFDEMNTISFEDVIGVSAYSMSEEKIKHNFFRNKKSEWKEDKTYRTTFNNYMFCRFYGSIFMIEISQTDFLANNPAYFLIYNKDIAVEKKNEQEKFVSGLYFSALGVPDYKNSVFLNLKKRAEALGFTSKYIEGN